MYITFAVPYRATALIFILSQTFKSSLFQPEDLDVTEDRVVYATENNSTFLECVPRSPQATVTWLIQRDDRKEEVRQSVNSHQIQDNKMAPYAHISTIGERWEALGDR